MFFPRRRRQWGGGGYGRGYGRAGRPGLGVLLLAAQMFQMGMNHIPPVTLAIVGANVSLFLRLFQRLLPKVRLPGIREACVSVFHVWRNRHWSRLFWASFIHVDEWHLYYNMASFLWKGRSLEPRMGSGGFLYLILVFSILTNCLLLALNLLAADFLNQPHYYTDCAVGFSGVIFALKVLTTHALPAGHRSSVMGFFTVPTRYACWVELVVTSLLLPNVSFVGHLAGILVGLAYVKGPLKNLMYGILPGTGAGARPSYTAPRTARTAGTVGGATTGSDESAEVQAAIAASLRAENAPRLRPLSRKRETSRPTLSQTTSQNHDSEDDRELQRAIQESLDLHKHETTASVEPSAPPAHLMPDVQDNKEGLDVNALRQARLARFDRQT